MVPVYGAIPHAFREARNGVGVAVNAIFGAFGSTAPQNAAAHFAPSAD